MVIEGESALQGLHKVFQVRAEGKGGKKSGSALPGVRSRSCIFPTWELLKYCFSTCTGSVWALLERKGRLGSVAGLAGRGKVKPQIERKQAAVNLESKQAASTPTLIPPSLLHPETLRQATTLRRSWPCLASQ